MNNIKANTDYCKEVKTTTKGKIRKVLSTIDVYGKTWNEKRKIIEEILIKSYGKIPDEISFYRIKTKDFENNIDGLRIFVVCDWIKRNRFYDNKGIFKIGSLLNAINKQIEGKTKENILKMESL